MKKIMLFVVISLLCLPSYSVVFGTDDRIDLPSHLSKGTLELRFLNIQRECRGIKVADNMILTLDHCADDDKTVEVNGEVFTIISEHIFNGLALLRTSSYIDGDIRAIKSSKEITKVTMFNNKTYSICSVQTKSGPSYQHKDGGRPTMDKDGVITGLVYATTFTYNSGYSVLSNCIPKSIINIIMKK